MSKGHLSYISARKAVEQAREQILREREDIQYGLYSPYSSLNIAMGKYFRFNNVNLWAGLSGHGKSYLLNTLNKSFLDVKENGINSGFPDRVIVLHFCFEMSAYNEILRSVASDMGVSYGYLLSSQYNKKEQTYNKVTDEDLKRVDEYLEYYANTDILFFENSGNLLQIYNTVEKLNNHFNNGTVKTSENKVKFIINIDHTLLIEQLDERSTLDLMANTGKVSIIFRKNFYAMVNLVGQLNNNIEDDRRLLTPSLHYPMKKDIYAQGQLYNACDNVFTIHQPSKLGITTYGARNLPTQGLMHLLKLKSRHGSTGSIWLKNNLANGKVDQTSIKELLKPNDDLPTKFE